ncbi:16S rRNA (guanine(527)-N(7))-methyltransferase RsmG [Chromatium okenii]|uniref:16S rRNA (guanine(527)-N(7))-methyltransferase RsmG n=1 Tax=Chromatium okenii TaxID=61644 RepID=UPI0019069FB3|nr:16S rRNA (guanine(527)-N(7))-methyltransferase RsmG [Chromatium okenii]MBK1641511.1 16S rRNA (guanine(527)-N(7))-methyltransferase RsmG [Chromatium okenii]
MTKKTNPIAFDTAQLGERLTQGAAQMGLALTAEQHAGLLQFLALLARWNQVYNLTAVRDPLDMVARHLLDSVALLPYLDGERILDLGTGAGLPGIPLALLAPEREFVLLDSNGKKIRFVRQAVLELGLRNVAPVQARIDRYQPERLFTTLVSRAVAETDILPAQERLLVPTGRMLLMKGRCNESSWSAMADRVRVHPLQIPFLDGARHLLEMRK